MASVPAGTQLYHGTSSLDVVKGMEWLAFEPEHALIFARPRRGPPGGRRPGHGDEDEKRPENENDEERIELRGRHKGDWDEEHCEMAHDGTHDPWSRQGHAHMPPPPEMDDNRKRPGHRPGAQFEGPHPYGPPPRHHSRPRPPPQHHSGPPPPSHDSDSQNTFSDDPREPGGNEKGYLHTYVPTHPLRLLYIDGLSAGKTSNGTLDTQDLLILNQSTSPEPGSPMGGEIARAQGMCHLASTLWENKIDGILRMEAGFEIILCEFEGNVERKNVVAYNGERDEDRPGKGGKGRGGVMGGWRYVKAVSERFHGIGGDRVTLDYENFVSVFAYDQEGDMGLWKNDVVSDTPHPRLINASPEQLHQVRDAVTAMILKSDGVVEEGRNWQALEDMVIERYSQALHHLHTDASVRRSKENFAAYLNTLLRPFISPSARNSTLEIERCVAQIVPPFPLPPLSSASLAHTTLHQVTTRICSALVNALDASTLTLSRSLAATSSPPYHALDLIDKLVGYLQWTTWKECGSCADEEVCFIPIWPMGSLENHKNPQCVKEAGVGTGYWGRWGPPPGHGEPGKGRPGPEGPKLRNHKGGDGPHGPSPPHGSWKHGERKFRKGDRTKSGHCGPRGQRHGHGHGPSPHRVHGGRQWGVWNQLRMSALRVAAWFGASRKPHHADMPDQRWTL